MKPKVSQNFDGADFSLKVLFFSKFVLHFVKILSEVKNVMFFDYKPEKSDKNDIFTLNPRFDILL